MQNIYRVFVVDEFEYAAMLFIDVSCTSSLIDLDMEWHDAMLNAKDRQLLTNNIRRRSRQRNDTRRPNVNHQKP